MISAISLIPPGHKSPSMIPKPASLFPATSFPNRASVHSLFPCYQYIPNPDRTGINSGLQQNKSPAVPSVAIKQTVWAYTIDENLTSSQSIHWTQWRNSVSFPSFGSPPGPPIVPFSNPSASSDQYHSAWFRVLAELCENHKPEPGGHSRGGWDGICQRAAQRE